MLALRERGRAPGFRAALRDHRPEHVAAAPSGRRGRVEPLDRPARPGDIVVYVDPTARLVAHRVIETLPDGRCACAATSRSPRAPDRAPTDRGPAHVGRPGGADGRLEGPVARLLALGLPPLERGAPGVLAGLRRTVIAGVQLADRLWTAAPVRRLRRRVSRYRSGWKSPGPATVMSCLRMSAAAAETPPTSPPAGCREAPGRRGLAGSTPGHRRVRAGRGDWLALLRRRLEHPRRSCSPPLARPGDWPRDRGHLREGTPRSFGRRAGDAGGEGGNPTVTAAVSIARVRTRGIADDRCGVKQAALLLPLPLPPTRLAHIVAALCRTPSRA